MYHGHWVPRVMALGKHHHDTRKSKCSTAAPIGIERGNVERSWSLSATPLPLDSRQLGMSGLAIRVAFREFEGINI